MVANEEIVVTLEGRECKLDNCEAQTQRFVETGIGLSSGHFLSHSDLLYILYVGKRDMNNAFIFDVDENSE